MLRCQSRILEKMVYIVLLSKSLMVTVLKCRRKRGVIGFLPPPTVKEGVIFFFALLSI